MRRAGVLAQLGLMSKEMQSCRDATTNQARAWVWGALVAGPGEMAMLRPPCVGTRDGERAAGRPHEAPLACSGFPRPVRIRLPRDFEHSVAQSHGHTSTTHHTLEHRRGAKQDEERARAVARCQYEMRQKSEPDDETRESVDAL